MYKNATIKEKAAAFRAEVAELENKAVKGVSYK
jgi:hypothetical protein